MPDIPCGGQIFDFAFHPNQPIVYTGLITGEVKAFGYDEQGNHDSRFVCKPSKKSCRSLELNTSGEKLWSVGKAKTLHTIDTTTGQVSDARKDIHEAPINRVKHIMENMLVTGDDDGVVKLWDTRTPEMIREYTHHYDFISDFMWIQDKKHLVVTSGDGTLSVLDVRNKKKEPFAHSEDQEDELLSIVSIKAGSKVVVGTQLGILSIFNKNKGWGDCVDRVPGHPSSIDALCALPSSYPSSHSTILTGSSDGLLRAVQLLPTKLIGVIADHGDFPIERMHVDMGGEGRWVGSAGHEEMLKMTDLKDVFEDEDDGEDEGDVESEKEEEGTAVADLSGKGMGSDMEADEEAPVVEDKDSDDEEEEAPQEKKRKRQKQEKDELAGRKKKGKNQIDSEPSFFSGL
ncbi:WD40 repeat-like protein [Athelia psychrophila]|uniref:WD repeat-containing protein JIP5 n=1 Tax=Athelia psychrophila TaxID=1759441 RepID=A0A166EKX6_9AGAM|nr:WD40 repeat-like protein [Fibularhizoctonia sp. CBS 109695]